MNRKRLLERLNANFTGDDVLFGEKYTINFFIREA
jgi:hypothetical protein